MRSIRKMRAFGTACLVAGMLAVSAGAASAQEAATVDPNQGALTISGGYDFLNQYMFRGLRQHSTGVAMWPWADLGIEAFSGDGGLQSVGLNFGTWNSLHTGDTGADSGKMWYESDFYASLGLGFGGGVSLGTTYTAYTSPNSTFTSVKEIMFKVSVDDSAYLGAGALSPYVAVAFELDAAPGVGQADGGLEAGKYLELGVGPGVAAGAASIAFPVKVGLSLADYYELDGTDNKFGFFSVGAMATVPLGPTTSYGAWNLHGGVEFQKLGDTTAFYNGDDDSQVIGSIGIGFSY